MYFYIFVLKIDKVLKIKLVNVVNDIFYEFIMLWKLKFIVEIKKIDGVIIYVMFVVMCNSNWN